MSDDDQSIEYRDDVLGGELVFSGTRVPAATLFDYLLAGDTLDDFLADYPTVSRQQAERCLTEASRLISQRDDNARTAR